MLGRGDVGLTDIEVEDVESSGLGVVGIGDELTDGRGGHYDAALGY